ncbi:MAG: adenosylcobinamide-GDP ribazoletransferase [Ruminococcus sp.]|jgi:adenosylcobinamide-GDP ribazoletransferase|nr:adenosylcobinamide-GDP ribazoletransferase [Ruminococcus sp.]
MIFLRSLASAFLMYSRIPVPSVEWKEENRRYALCFFPLVGVVVGMLFLLWRYVCLRFGVGGLLTGAVSAAVPVLITGGIHFDGFCDVIDASSSYADRSKKLQIMSDPHIGSFASVYAVLFLLVQTAAMSEVSSAEGIAVVSLGFVLSRALSGIGAVCFKSARSSGALHSFVMPAHRKITLLVLALTAVSSVFAMMLLSFIAGLTAAVGALCCFAYYRFFSYKNFGGVTGDLAGWFLQLCELVILLAVTAAEKIMEVLL